MAWRGLGPALAVWAVALGPAAAAETRTGTVEFVADGDTAFVQAGAGRRLKCRLAGIDAPEVSHPRRAGGQTPGQPYGLEAKRALETWALRRRVTVEVYGRDTYRRPLCVLHAGGRNLNLDLVREGLAWVEHGRGVDAPPSLRRELVAAEREARSARRGLWANGNPEPPWQFRKRARVR